MKQSISNTVNQVNRIVAQTKKIVGEFQSENKVNKIEIDLLRKHVIDLYDVICSFENAEPTKNETSAAPQTETAKSAEVRNEEEARPTTTANKVEERQSAEVVMEKEERMDSRVEEAKHEEDFRAVEVKEEEDCERVQQESCKTFATPMQENEEEKKTEVRAETKVMIELEVEEEEEESEEEETIGEEETIAEEEERTIKAQKEEVNEEIEQKEVEKEVVGIFGRTIIKPTFTPVPQQTIAEKLANHNTTIADKLVANDNSTLGDKPIKDIKSAITINDKLAMTRELFESSNDNFVRAISILNGFGNKGEALFFLESLKKERQWSDDLESYIRLRSIVERKIYQ